ncbi:TonB-dependent receptor [Rhodospirillum rubrum]|uniref:TonB-dependent receptor n=1 Tax=Rhodospirillum rubrum TaxID=1085 RepID=UPI001ED94964|nr:TonB-dependent receptor [Rhodospirillum rubrum]
MAPDAALAQDATLAPGATLAQGAADPTQRSIVLPQMVVSGEKIERPLEDTASSVAILPAEDLEDKSGAASVADAIADVPNVLYTGTVGAPIIRGQDTQGPNFGSTAFFGGTIPRATVNLDGHYQNYYEYVFGTTSIWDVESVEVFRGPQTTSQGANAIAGAIIVNTKDPTFEPEASYLAEIGSYSRRRTALALSGPIIADQLAARMAIDYSGRDTFVEYVNSNFDTGDADLDFRSLTARGKLLWEPEALPDLTAKLTYAFGSANRPTWESASRPYDELDNATLSMPSWEQRTHTGIADLSYAFANDITLFNQTQYSDTHVDRVTEPANNGSAVIDQNTVSNELRLTLGDTESTLSGMTGLYLARTRSKDTLHIRGLSRFDDEKQHAGLFSEMAYRLTDRWTLTGGLRYQRDHILRSGTSSYARTALDYDESFDAWLPKVSLAYDVTPEVTVGALVNRGYNPGGVNLSFASSKYVTFEPETVWNYEVFSRAKLLDDRLILTGNLFYSRHSDSQRLLPDYLNGVQYGSVVVNADKAQSYGLELAVDYKMRDDLRVRAGAGLLKTRIGSFSNAEGTSYEGNEFGRAPSYTLSLGMDWDITPKVRLSGEVKHTDGYYSTDENISAYAVENYTVANARIGYAPREYLEVYVFANNIFDKRAPAYLYDDRSAGGIVANMIEPRTVGIGVKGTF